jgi:polyhydroxyalkanoate synthesis regulator phasin
MITEFNTFLTEQSGQKNTHMTHIEDKVLYGGVNGTRQAINALRSLRDMLAGKHEGSVSVKWDGAPAIFAGIDPRDGEFFVAKKGIFNKNPKVYKTAAEVDADTSGDLASKLKQALKYLPELGIKGVVQGDFLFSKYDLSTEKIDGQKYLTFHPNTIVYAVPADSDAAKQIKQAQMGIVWHTTYTGSTFESMSASYGVDVTKFKKSKNVWSQDAMLKDLTNATMSAAETKAVTDHLSNAGKLFNKVSSGTLQTLGANLELAQTIEQFNNTFVRKGEVITNTARHVNNLIRWITTKHKKEIDALKTPQGKARRQSKLDEVLSFFSPQNKASLKYIFDLQKELVLAKLKLINTLNRLQTIDTFVKTKNGFKVTGAEGFVAIDKIGGDAVKIVDRMEFSYNNFSPDILKGWDKPTRT